YFTVPLGPLVVALGAGLDAAGPAGVIAALVVCLGLWAGKPTAPAVSDKSNVDRLAVALHGELPRGTLIASPQPEQVPLLRRDLGGGLRFVTPLGRPTDPTVVDWVDALHRLRASRVSRTLAPAVRRLRPRGRVLLASPEFGTPDSPWTIG